MGCHPGENSATPLRAPFDESRQESRLTGHDEFAPSLAAGGKHLLGQSIRVELLEGPCAAGAEGFSRQAGPRDVGGVAIGSFGGAGIDVIAADRPWRHQEHVGSPWRHLQSDGLDVGRERRLRHAIGAHEWSDELAGEAADVDQMAAGGSHVVGRGPGDLDR